MPQRTVTAMTETQTLTLAEFLLARIAEREREAWCGTVVISGGAPAPEVPNCIGPSRTGDCPEQWRLKAEPTPGWWKRPDVMQRMREHELSHATAAQRRVRAECQALRRVVAEWGPFETYDGEHLLRVLAVPYADHPDFRDEWRSS